MYFKEDGKEKSRVDRVAGVKHVRSRGRAGAEMSLGTSVETQVTMRAGWKSEERDETNSGCGHSSDELRSGILIDMYMCI